MNGTKFRGSLMARWKKESRLEDWRDFDAADYRFTLADILAEFEKEEGVCLTRLPRTTPTPARWRRARCDFRAHLRKSPLKQPLYCQGVLPPKGDPTTCAR
jgi:hypothetical protein